MAPSMGYATRVGLTAIGASGAATQEMEFDSCDLAKREEQWQPEGIRGVRGRQSEIVAALPYVCNGALVTEPRTDELVYYLHALLGATPSGTTFGLADTLPTFGMDVYKIVDTYRYAGCKMNDGTFVSRSGQPLRLTMNIEATSETGSLAFPNIGASLSTRQPYMHHEAVLTLGGTPYTPSEIEISVNNALMTDRFLNALTRSELPETDRIVTLAVTLPFTSAEAALYAVAIGGISGSVVYTKAATSTTFTFGVLQTGTVGPGIPNRNGEVMRRITFRARRTGSTAELVVTHDSTP